MEVECIDYFYCHLLFYDLVSLGVEYIYYLIVWAIVALYDTPFIEKHVTTLKKVGKYLTTYVVLVRVIEYHMN